MFCDSCEIDVDADQFMSHSKMEFHVYNMKRKLSDLPAISLKVYEDKKKYIAANLNDVKHQKSYCQYCRKSFSNAKTYENHINSKSHIVNVKNYKFNENDSSIQTSSEQVVVSDTESDEAMTNIGYKPIPVGNCIFCMTKANSGKAILEHMENVHKFVVPFKEKLVDLDGFLAELGRIVGEERACINCGRQFYSTGYIGSVEKEFRISLQAVRNHMLGKEDHHQVYYGIDDPVMIALSIAQAEENAEANDVPYETPIEARVGGEFFHQFYDGSSIGSKIVNASDSDDAYEIVLPSGTTIGHRKFFHIYKQNLPKQPDIPVKQLALHGRGANKHLMLAGKTNLPDHFIKADQHGGRCSRYERSFMDQSRLLDVGVKGNLFMRGNLRRQY